MRSTAAGEGSSSIDNPHGLELPGDGEAILREMFATYERVTVVDALEGGFSGSRVFVVHPVRADGLPELPTVVKIGPRAQINREWQAYQTHVQNRLPGVAAIQGAPNAPQGAAWAGLRYPLVGSGTFSVESLAHYYGRGSAADMRYVLELRLFRQLGALWRFNQPAPAFSLRDSYDHLLPVNLLIRLEAGAGSGARHVLDAAPAMSARIDVGERVCLRGFVVAEVEAKKREVTLNVPEKEGLSPRSYRVRLTGVEAPKAYAVGAMVAEVEGRVVGTRRDTLAAIALEVWGVDFAVDAEQFRLSSGRTLPNPLARLPAVLAARPTVRVAGIHGDLNPQNVLVDPDTREVRLIDFADARQDHVLHDLLRLETGIVTRLLPATLEATGLPPEVIVALYEQLAQDPDGAAARATPALAKVSAMLAAVRTTARAYLFDPNDWREYGHGLTLYLLGAHKYRNLDATAKKVAFLGAAATQQLVAASAVVGPQARAQVGSEGDGAPVRRRPPLLPPAEERPSPPPSPPARRPGTPWWLPATLVLVAFLIVLGAVILRDADGSEDNAATAAATRADPIAVAVAPPTVAATATPSATPPAATATVAVAVPPTAVPTLACAPRGAARTIVVLLDRSQSMRGEPLLAAIDGLRQFVNCLNADAEIAVYTFNDSVQQLQSAAPVGDVGEMVNERLGTLFADGESALYDAVCTVMDVVNATEDERTRTVILLSDGPDTVSTTIVSETALFACIPDGVRLHTIAYGPDADADLLARLAAAGDGDAVTAEPGTIARALQRISLVP